MTVDRAKAKRPQSREIEDVSLLLTYGSGKFGKIYPDNNASIRLEPGKDASARNSIRLIALSLDA